jgi:hypothetical protein
MDEQHGHEGRFPRSLRPEHTPLYEANFFVAGLNGMTILLWFVICAAGAVFEIR